MPVLPGATLGILGGGQLARMGAMAARSMGYKVVVLDPDPNCCAGPVADHVMTAALDDVDAAIRVAQQVAVLTYDIEKIGPEVIAAVTAYAPLRPGGHVVRMVQDRAVQKNWLRDHEFAVATFVVVESAADVARSLHLWRQAGRLKTRQGGYDGRGQVRCLQVDAAAAAWQQLGGLPCVLEQEQSLAAELSILVARCPGGAMALHPAAQNWHDAGVLTHSVIPASLPDTVLSQACCVAQRLAETLALEGLLAVEFFWTQSGQLLINELAPRPHNTFHHADMACETSQFEQWIRAICDLPLGQTHVVRPVGLANLLGDLWQAGTPAWQQALAMPGVTLRLYDKAPRPGRKMGHVLAGGVTSEDAVDRVLRAKGALFAT